MSDEQQPHAQAGPVGWQPIPRGAEYDAEGTTFLQLPPELLAHPGAALSGTGTWDPLAATGAGGYTPPTGEPWQQPHAPAQGQWSGQWGAHAPYEPPQADAPADGGTRGRGADPHATAEWAMPFAPPSDAPPEPQETQAAHPADRTAQGHWTVPAAGDDPVDESGEYVLHGRQPAQHTDPHDPVAAYAVPQPPTAPGPHDSAYAPPHAAPAQDTGAPGADPHAHTGVQGAGVQGADPHGRPGAQAVGTQGVDPHGRSGAQAAAVPGVDPHGRSGAQVVGAQGADSQGQSAQHVAGAQGLDLDGQPGARDAVAQGADPHVHSAQQSVAAQGADLHGQPGAQSVAVPSVDLHGQPVPQGVAPHVHSAQQSVAAQGIDLHGQLGAQSVAVPSVDLHGQSAPQSTAMQGADPHVHSAQQSVAAQGADLHGQPGAQSVAVPSVDLHGQPVPQSTAMQGADPHGQPAPQDTAVQGIGPQGQSAPQAAAAPGVGPHGHSDPHLPADPQASARHAPGADAPGADASGAYVLSGGTDPQGADLHGHSDSHAPAQWTPHGGSVHAWQQPVAVSLPGDSDDAPAAGPTGQWSIPVVSGEPADESGEYALSGLAGATPGPSDADSTSPSGGSSQNDTGVTDTSDHRTGAWTPPAEPVAAAQEESPDDDAPPADDLAETEPPHAADTADTADPHTEHPCASYVLRVNGTDRPVTDAWIGESLLYVLRERLGLAGAKDGCSQGECGACSVQVDGRLVASCLVPAATAAGAEVRTVEGLAVDGRPSDVQRALAECGAVQCGFCVPGMAMTMHDLLEGNHAPSELETRQAICGNLCRCSGYRGVLDAVRQVVDERAATAAAQEEAQPETEQARIPHQAGPHGGGSGKAAE
ncbi:2Fe-2S iron-sulfur cluster-binding protein [Streptomyces olivoreticuli]